MENKYIFENLKKKEAFFLIYIKLVIGLFMINIIYFLLSVTEKLFHLIKGKIKTTHNI